MLNEAEVEEAYNHFYARLRWYRENVEDIHDRAMHLSVEYGLDPKLMLNIVDNIAERNLGLPSDILLLAGAASQLQCISAAVYIGVALGRKMSEIVAVDLEDV